MPLCFYCGEDRAPSAFEPEHIVPAAVGGRVVSRRVCATCNRRAGVEVDQPWLEMMLVLAARQRHDIRDRRGRAPKTITRRGRLVGDGTPALVRIRGDDVDIQPLPSERQDGDMTVVQGTPADVDEIRKRILKKDPDADWVDLDSYTVNEPLSAEVDWALNPVAWPRFGAKVALGVASLFADDTWAQSERAGELRTVLWNGPPDTDSDDVAQNGRAWSGSPFVIPSGDHPLQPPEHLLVVEGDEGTMWATLVAFGSLMYSVPIGINPHRGQPMAWLTDPTSQRHAALTAAELRAEYASRGHAAWARNVHG